MLRPLEGGARPRGVRIAGSHSPNGADPLAVLGALASGVGLMYLADPERGRRRRALVRDRLTSIAARADDVVSTTARDLGNRVRGSVAELRALARREPVPDRVLAERVRAKLGFAVSHPHAIEVEAAEGRITLRGAVLKEEADHLVACASAVRGVQAVDDRLERHASADAVPSLQGGERRTGAVFDILQTNWAPATRLLAGLGGGALALYGLGRRGPLGIVSGLAGSGLALRALTNLELSRLTGIGAGRRAVEVQKTIEIAAPRDEVFAFWSEPENFPAFMTNVREVRDLGDGRSRWTVAGPGGTPLTWEAMITRSVPDELLAWKSAAGALVANAGIIRFEESARGTRVHIRLSYNPPGGALGHAMAVLFGADPKSEMDADLMRVKTTLEGGTPPRDAAAPTSPVRAQGDGI